MGIPCHRVDARDAFAAGVPIYDLKTREPLTPAVASERALDNDAFDPNLLAASIAAMPPPSASANSITPWQPVKSSASPSMSANNSRCHDSESRE